MAFKMKRKGFPMKSPLEQEKIGSKFKKVKAYRAGYDPNVSFQDAFRAARDAGVKKFTWRGKSYTTETKE